MRFRVLGPLEVFDGDSWHAVPTAKTRLVLATLLIESDGVVSVDQLADAVWGGFPPRTSANQIHGHVARLRKLMADRQPCVLVTHHPGYQLSTAREEVDAHRFTALAADGHRALLDGDFQRARADLAAALRLWRGAALADVPATAAVATFVAGLEEERLAALEHRVEADLACGQHGSLVAQLQSLTREHPLRERFWQQYMLTLYRCGRQAEALGAYRRVHRLLADELAVAPSVSLQDLHGRILAADPSLHQTRTPPRRSAGGVAPRPNQLPGDIVEFTGRSAERETIVDWLSKPTASLHAIRTVTIEGMAGMGKTRLAIHVAHELATAFPDGQFAVDLGGSHGGGKPETPGTVLERLLCAMGVARERIPADLDARAALYRQRLNGRRILVVLDDAAGEEQVTPLLPGSADSAVLVTSRRSLALDGARRLPLREFTDDDAQQLLWRITGRDEDSSALVNLCGNMPLAIALVAHRLVGRPQWSVADLVARLRRESHLLSGISAGSRRLETVFHSSYLGLKPPERRAFGLLGLHPGTAFSALSASALLGVNLSATEGLLDTLVDEHLLMPTSDGRYRFHELVRVYAAARAQEQGSHTAAIRRLMRWYLYSSYHAAGIIAEHVSIIPLEGEAPVTALPSLSGYDDAMAWLDAESQAIEESVRISHEYGCDDVAWRLPIATLAWNARADHRRGWTQMIDTALSAAERCADLRGKAQILRIMGLNHNDSATAVRLLLEAAQLCREVDDPRGLAAAYNNLGVVYGRMEDYESAAKALERALEIHKRIGSDSSSLRTMNNLGKALRGLGEHDRALEILAEVLTARRQAGDEGGTASVLNTIGETLIASERYDEAIECLLESHALHQSFHLYPHNLSTLLMLGDALSITGKTAQARELWQAGLSISEGFEAAETDHFRRRLRAPRADMPNTAAAARDHG